MPEQISQSKPPGQKVVLVIVCLAFFLMAFTVSAVNVALPAIGREFKLDAVLLSWVATTYTLSAAVFMVPMGRLADIRGRKRIFLGGIITYAVASLGCGFAASGGMLIACRVVQGIGGAMVMGTAPALVTATFPVGERGRALGVVVAMVYVGMTAGPFLGGLMTSYLGWRALFFANAIASALVIIGVFWKLRGEWADARGEKFDLVGALIFGLGVVCLIYGFTLLPQPLGFGVMTAGLILLAAFVRHELRAESPVLNIRLFSHNRVFAFSSLATLINYAATFAVAFLLSLYLQYVQDFSPVRAGTVILVMPAVQAVFSPLSGRLSDRVEPQLLASMGMSLCAVGLLLLSFLDAATGVAYILGSLVLLGLGFALFSSPNTNAIMSSVAKRDYGIAGAVMGTTRVMGQTLSLSVVMLLLALYVGDVEITAANHPALIKSLKVSFTIFAVLCGGGVFASLARGKSHCA